MDTLDLLVSIMIYAGSALMIYNIIRYGKFVKTSMELDKSGSRSLLIVPLLLLIFFLIGYVGVAVSGIGTPLIAAILLGGSIFVFLLLTVMYSIVGHIRQTDRLLSQRYEEMKSRLGTLSRDAFAVFLVDLTKDEIEDRAGTELTDEDHAHRTYSELYEARCGTVVSDDPEWGAHSAFRRGELLRRYQNGQTRITEIVLTRRPGGASAYVRLEATMTALPVSGDVVATIVERPYDEQIVHRALLEDVLMDEYDRIAYLSDGRYRKVISNDDQKTGMLLPPVDEDSYESLYFNYILPAQQKDGETPDGPNPLRLSVIDKALAEEKVYQVDAPFTIDGETHWKHFVFYRIDSKAKFYLMLLSDSTQRQEEQSARGKQLADALAEAVRSNQARTRFFTHISHGLRTPMNGILGFAGLARTENDPAKLHEYLDKVDVSGRRLLSLMDDLLSMSLIDSGKLTLAPEAVELPALAEKIKKNVTASWAEKKIEVVTDTSGLRDTTVMCDPQRLQMVLGRLLENACYFADEGGSVYLDMTQEEAPTFAFRVRSCGIQIPPEVLPRIFEAEVWSDNLGESLPGAGLGMVVAKSFVDYVGGSVDVQSAADGETAFTVRLPLEAVASSRDEHGHIGKALHILLVDDNEINREIAELLLTSEGWTVEQAENGAQAVEKFTAASPGTYDLILMDVQMPVMNGYEATAKIRALPDKKAASIPIIAVTANAYQEDANEALEAGMDGYVSKPIDPDTIRTVIERILTEKQGG